MKNIQKGFSTILLIIVIFIILLVCYFFFFVYVSEAKALKILKADYQQKQSAVCDRFMVSTDKCAEFVVCYAEKASNAMPRELLVQFAKDVRGGKSSAIDSYNLVAGGNLGGQCISEILNIPSKTKIMQRELNPSIQTGADSVDAEYLILKDIGSFKYVKYIKTPGTHKGISRTEYSASYIKDGVSYGADVNVFANEADQKSYFNGYLLNFYAGLGITTERTIAGITVHQTDPKQKGEKLTTWAKGNYSVLLSEPADSNVLFDAYFNR